MPRQTDSPGHRHWVQLIARSAVLVAVAAVITFSPDHSPLLGLAVLGGGALLLGAISLAGSRSIPAATRLRTVQLGFGVATLVIGAAAAVAAVVVPTLPAFIVAGVALGVAALVAELSLVPERAAGLPAPLDHRILAAVAALLVIGLLLSGGNSVVAVGLLGAWAAVTAVYSLITAFTLKWESGQPAAPVETR